MSEQRETVDQKSSGELHTAVTFGPYDRSMRLTNERSSFLRAAGLRAAGLAALFAVHSYASTFVPSVFATGTPLGATQPDSVVAGDGSLWVAYTNGAASDGTGGSSTVVRYSFSGSVTNTWTIAGNVDGLRVDPNGNVWALQNNDGNSTLTVINPVTNGTTPYTYGNTYTNIANQGFDDVEFLNGKTYLSETNPPAGTSPIIWQLTSGLNNPLQVAAILTSTFTGTNLATGTPQSTTIGDSDSLILDGAGDLVLTGESDQEIVIVHNPGAANQSESFINLTGLTSTQNPDDTVFPNAANGTFYVADTGGNTVYAINATGLTPGSVYVDVGTIFGLLNLSTGAVTPIFTGVSPHGVFFVAAPEPATFLTAGLTLLLGGWLVLRRRRRI